MNHTPILHDPAFPAMTMDILNNMLSRSDNPGQLSTYLTEETRELTGARCVLLVQCLENTHRVIAINPERQRDWAQSPEAQPLYEAGHELTETCLWEPEAPAKVNSLLRKHRFDISMVAPLQAGDIRIGALLLLGLPDKRHIDTLIHLMTTLSKILALMLRNALLYEDQEKTIEEGTKELMLYGVTIDNMKDAVFWINPDASFQKVNSSACKMLDYSDRELSSLCLTDISPEFNRGNWTHHWEKLKLAGAIDVETVFRTRDGRDMPVDISATYFEFEGNAYNCAIVRDITSRKRAEEALRESEDKFKYIFDHSVIGKSITAPSGELQMNAAFYKMLGYSPEQFKQLKWQQVTHPDDIDASQQVIDSLLSRKITKERFTKRYFHRDGSVVWADVSTSLRRDKDGNPLYFISTIRDITEQRHAQQIRARLERNLQQAQKMESIGTLAGGIAHDFNNILFPIIGFAEMLQEDLPQNSPEQAHTIEILHAALRAKDLVKQILTFSRQSDQERKPVRLQSIVKEALKLLKSSIPTTIDIQADISPDCGLVVADPTQIHQIVMNLATNAYHAMQESGGHLNLTLIQTEIDTSPLGFSQLLPGSYAFLKITDTGIGIQKEVIDKIFDPYFTTKKTGKGTGLGLSVVQGIIKSCHGHISAYSEPGKGTEFHVYLPIIKKITRSDSLDPSEPIKGGTEKILLVDDEEMIIKMEKQMLERLGYQVTAFSGSTDAFAAFKLNPDAFDLIVSDMTMPHMTGVQLANKVKTIRRDMPVVICTGFSDQINEESVKKLGIQGYVMKPVIKKEIADTIRTVLNESKNSHNGC